MKLAELGELGTLLQGDPGCTISRIAYDSRRVEPGDLFVAISGLRDDGHRYAGDAIARGAVALMVERYVPAPSQVGVLRVPSARAAMARAAARLHRWPARRLRMVGVTGTNGKTTTTHLVRAILAERGHRVGLLGTVHNYIGDEVLPVEHTTPESVDLQAHLARMAGLNTAYAVMEVSSHALELHRVDQVEFDIAVFTNLTRDHLDFHPDLEAYRAAKGRLFASLGLDAVKGGPKAAILNADDPTGDFFRTLCQVPVITYGVERPADVTARDIRVTPAGAAFTLVTPAGDLALELSLTGRFNVYNSLAAVAVALVEGIDLEVVRRALERTRGVAGRLEAVNAGQPFGVFVDYAHTPDGLCNVLQAVRSFTRGRLICLFGCGGDRDPGKRAQMGRISAYLADYTIITSDNPRSEDPEAIVRQIEAGVREISPDARRYEVQVDRAAGIRRAVELAGPQDVIVIAGKGHETYQIFKDRTIPFDDREVARQIIAGRMARRGSA